MGVGLGMVREGRGLGGSGWWGRGEGVGAFSCGAGGVRCGAASPHSSFQHCPLPPALQKGACHPKPPANLQ